MHGMYTQKAEASLCYIMECSLQFEKRAHKLDVVRHLDLNDALNEK